MKTLIISITVSLCSILFQKLEAQENLPSEEKRTEFIQQKKEEIIKEEKALLKYKVERINERLEKNLITAGEATTLKNEAAEIHAKNIENRIAILENETELKNRNEDFRGYISLGGNGKILDIKVNEERERLYDKRTTTDLVIAAGFNNALEDGQSLNDSDFKIGGSRFFEIGWAWKTRVFENSNWLRVKYGVSFQFNGLKPTDNRYFVENDKETTLQSFDYDLKKSKFRMDNLVAPVHFEFGPSTKVETDRSIRYSTVGKLKIGLGGYAGFNIGERQKLKYKVDGDKVKEKLKNDYNTNDLVYGLSAYLGWGGATLYGKYDLNPIFKDPNRELHNFSLGLRFDVD
ncbi:YbaB/EbfC family nucleoid-associated protein [Salegentibacter sediminis]|uniref:YbaB/EbfC family nucleoid-associated protein n=1 Tax=Salegentibacter sediminis TaxID=1930251 RepID=UPI0009BE77AC|nr:YbaB/EbfC family nucleoid-associated protein [Salegentibacter sediminis]